MALRPIFLKLLLAPPNSCQLSASEPISCRKGCPRPLTPRPGTAPQHSVPSGLGATHLPSQGLHPEPSTSFLYRQLLPFHWRIPVSNYAASHFKHFGIKPSLDLTILSGTITWTTLLDNLAVSTSSSPAVHFFFFLRVNGYLFFVEIFQSNGIA